MEHVSFSVPVETKSIVAFSGGHPPTCQRKHSPILLYQGSPLVQPYATLAK